MLENCAKRIVLQVLQRDPDLSGLDGIPSLQSRKGRQLLRWLDQGGLALQFLSRVQAHESVMCLPGDWRKVLEQRRERNANRLRDMLREFQRLNQAFRSRGILVATLKGFSLVPDFCGDPAIRHQTDFDFLVDPSDLDAVAEILFSFGYSTPRLSRSEESSFTTPLRHVPSPKDDLYVPQHHRQVDLHVALSESPVWITIDFPSDCLQHAVPLTLRGVQFHGLSLADRFLSQVLHAFRHSTRSWLRLSWLLEIARCMEFHRENEALWARVIERAGSCLLMKRIFASVLGLTGRLFQSRVPLPVRSWATEGMTPTMRVWLEHFSVNWAVSDWPGNLGNLFLASEFIPDEQLRKRYFASRLIPKGQQTTIEAMASKERKRSIAWNIQRWQFVARRSAAHLKDVFRLPLEQLRWRRALAAGRSAAFEWES